MNLFQLKKLIKGENDVWLLEFCIGKLFLGKYLEEIEFHGNIQLQVMILIIPNFDIKCISICDPKSVIIQKELWWENSICIHKRKSRNCAQTIRKLHKNKKIKWR